MGPRLLLAMLLTASAAGCWTGQRRPLFGGGGGPDAQSAPALLPPPSARPYGSASELELIQRLREAPAGDQRGQVVDELLRRGAVARPVLVAALEEELVLADVIDEALRRLEGAPDPGAKPAQGLSDPPWVEEKYRLALDHYMAGDVYGALRRIDAVLALEPHTVQTERLQRLRRRVLEKLIRETVLVAEIAVEDAVLTPGDRLRGGIRLTNLSQDTITLRSGEQGEVGFFNVSYEELSPSGARTRLHVEHVIDLDDELEIPPGESRDLPFPVAANSHHRLARGRVGRYHLGGRLRPQTFLVGDSPYSLFVPVLPEQILVLEPRDLELAAEPATSFLRAVEGGLSGALAGRDAGRQVFVTAIVMARDDPEGTVRALISALEGAEGGLSEGLCAALARVTGEPLGFTREEWLLWWRLRRTRPQKQTEPQ